MIDNKYTNVNNEAGADSSLEHFTRRVFDKLISDGVPPIPYYYKVYFFNELDEENDKFKKQIYELIAVEESSDLEKDLEFERILKKSFKYSKELLNRVAMTYKISKKLQEVLAMQLQEASHVTNNKALIKLISGFQNNLKLIDSKLKNEIVEIKNIYAKNISTLKNIESNSIYDSRYGVYKKNYFLSEVKKELILINKFHHVSSVLLVKLKDDVFNKIKSEKSRILVNRSLAKIMLKTSRRTDIIANFEENIFAMLLKHTDIIGAQKTVERLADTISNAAIFLEEEEVELQIVAGIIELKESKKNVETFVSETLKSLNEAEKNEQLYAIAKVN